MKVKILGTGGAFDAMPTSYIIEDTILVDTGIETVKKIVHSKEIDKIKKVFITHLHVDHIAGFELLVYYWDFFGINNVEVYAGSDFMEYYKTLPCAKKHGEFFMNFKFTCFHEGKYITPNYDIEEDMFVNIIKAKHMQGELPAYSFVFGFNRKRYEKGIAIITGDIDEPCPMTAKMLETINAYIFHDMGSTGYDIPKEKRNHPTEDDVFKMFGESERVIGIHTNAELKKYRKAKENEIFEW